MTHVAIARRPATLALTLLIALAAGGCDGNDEPPAEVAGVWSGWWSGTRGDAGAIFIKVVQAGNEAIGTGTVGNLGSVSLVSTLAGRRWTGHIRAGNVDAVAVDLIVAGDRASGRYTNLTDGSAGTMSLAHEPTAAGEISTAIRTD
jgi:hypothetical protein